MKRTVLKLESMHLLYMVEEDNRVIFGKVQSKEKQVNLI